VGVAGSGTAVATRATPLPSPPPQGGSEQTESAETSSAQTTSIADQPADLAKLPPIESITAESDIRAFLAPGIPPELTRAALRRAWVADPKIREFVGLSENSWDFNVPGAMAGFGPLEMTDELRRQIAQFVGRNLATDAADAPASTSKEGQEARAAIETSALSNAGDVPTREPATSRAEPVTSGVELPDQLLQCDIDHTTHCEPERGDRSEPTAKGHGRALPK
jgi:hypothetical protein